MVAAVDEDQYSSDCEGELEGLAPSNVHDGTTEGAHRLRVVFHPPLPNKEMVEIFTLPDPRTGKGRQFCVAGGTFCELLRHGRSASTWFLGDEVVEDGALWVISPLDPLFIALRFLVKQSADRASQFCSLDDLIPTPDSAMPAAAKGRALLRAAVKSKIGALCDTVSEGEEVFLQFQPSKAVVWLRLKLKKLQECRILEEWYWRDAGVMKDKGAERKELEDKEKLMLGLHLIHEYTEPGMFHKLCEAVDVDPKEFEREQGKLRGRFRDMFAERDVDLKRRREEEEERVKKARMASASAAVKRLAKEGKPKGTKSITSFFAKKA